MEPDVPLSKPWPDEFKFASFEDVVEPSSLESSWIGEDWTTLIPFGKDESLLNFLLSLLLKVFADCEDDVETDEVLFNPLDSQFWAIIFGDDGVENDEDEEDRTSVLFGLVLLITIVSPAELRLEFNES